MNINPETIIQDREGTQRVTLKASLLFLLDNASPGEREKARQMGRLADKISDSNGSVELEDGDIKLVRDCLDADRGMKVWALEALEYNLWPQELADSDRERLSRKFGE